MFVFPAEHDNPTARVLGRLFGVRDIVLGGLSIAFADDPRVSRRLHRAIACVDAGDATSGALALARREGIDRAALLLFAVAASATATGIRLARAEDEKALRAVGAS